MAENYKTIRAFHDLARALMAKPEWNQTKIMEEAGITHKLMREILDYDPVSVKIRSESVEKLKAFIARDWSDPFTKEPKPITEAPKDIPYHPDKDLLSRLGNLINEFQGRGYKLDIQITRIYNP